jgi:thiamine biosynthesis lipoprotein
MAVMIGAQHSTRFILLLLLAAFLLAVSLVIPLAGCRVTPAPQATLARFEYARIVMGSRARVVLYAASEPVAAGAAEAAFEEMIRLEGVLSDYDPGSEAMRLCRAPAGVWHAASVDLVDVLEKSRGVWAASGTVFDPTVGPLTRLWRETRESGVLPPSGVLKEAMGRVGFEHVRSEPGRVRLAREGMVLDFGGIGKGYAADRALEVLRELGHERAMCDLGGDLAVGGPPPGRAGWTLRVQSGLGKEETVVVSNAGVATSGDLERFVEIGGTRYSHILDPRTGLGLTERVAVTVIAEEAWLADALASAASVLDAVGVDRLRARWPEAEIEVVKAGDD